MSPVFVVILKNYVHWISDGGTYDRKRKKCWQENYMIVEMRNC